MPVWWEWLRVFVALGSGSACLFAGHTAAQHSPTGGKRVAVAAAAIAVIAAADHYAPVRRWLGSFVSVVGGEGTVACLALLVLIGASLGGESGRVRPWLAALGTIISFVVIALFAAAPLYWHYSGQSIHTNLPDAEGKLQQTTGITCAPAAAAMLANLHGLAVSEGRLAEDAGSNPLIGTDEFALARALETASGNRLRGKAAILDYSSVERLHLPFVAYVRRVGVGGHAILVSGIQASAVHTIDPLTGATETISAEEFKSEWTGVAIWLER